MWFLQPIFHQYAKLLFYVTAPQHFDNKTWQKITKITKSGEFEDARQSVLVGPQSFLALAELQSSDIQTDHFFQTIKILYMGSKGRCSHHTLPFKFYRCCGHKMVPEIHSSILSFPFLLFSFHLMAVGKHSFTLLVHKDEMVCWECSVTGMGWGAAQGWPGTFLCSSNA